MQLLVQSPLCGGGTLCLALPSSAAPTALAVKRAVCDRTAVPLTALRLSSGTRDLRDDEEISSALALSLQSTLRLRGGKGGFGAQLKAAGGPTKKETNFGACRDLQGRRVRHTENESKLREWAAQAPEREAAKEATQKAKRESREADWAAARASDERKAVSTMGVKDAVQSAVAAGLQQKRRATEQRRAELAAEEGGASAAGGSEAGLSSAAAAAPEPEPEPESVVVAAAAAAVAAPEPVAPAWDAIDLAQHASAEVLLGAVGAEHLKAELGRLGLKVGGAPLARAARLIGTRGLPPMQWDKTQLAGAKTKRKRKGGK